MAFRLASALRSMTLSVPARMAVVPRPLLAVSSRAVATATPASSQSAAQTPAKAAAAAETDCHSASHHGPMCPICANKIAISYKDTQLLSQFVSSTTGQILRRSLTGVCAKQQRKLGKAIKKSRQFGLMPHLNRDPKFTSTPVLFV